jgi:tetratricopeptide (TPR) repeat protein
MVAGNVGDYPTSLELTQQAREVFARQGDTEMETSALAQHATTLFNMSRYAEAQAALEEVLPIFRRSGHVYRVAVALGNLASIAAVQGRFGVTVRYAREAIELCRAMEESEAIAVDLLVLAHAELFTHQFHAARAHAEEAVAIARDLGNVPLEADGLTRLVHILLVLDEVDAAVQIGLESVEVGRTASSDLDRGYTHLSVGYALRWAGRYDEADDHFAEATSLFDGLDLATLTRECTVGRAWAVAARGDHARAVAMVEPALDHLTAAAMVGTCLPATMLLGCVEVLRFAQDPRTEDTLARARAYLHEIAGEIDDPVLREGYLTIPPNAVLLAEGPASTHAG